MGSLSVPSRSPAQRTKPCHDSPIRDATASPSSARRKDFALSSSLDIGCVSICLPGATFTSRACGGQRWDGTPPDFIITVGGDHQNHQPSGSRARLVGAPPTQSARIDASILTCGCISPHRHAVVTEQVRRSPKASASLLTVSDLGTRGSDPRRRGVNRNGWRRIDSRRRRLTIRCTPIHRGKAAMPQEGRYIATQACRLWAPR